MGTALYREYHPLPILFMTFSPGRYLGPVPPGAGHFYEGHIASGHGPCRTGGAIRVVIHIEASYGSSRVCGENLLYKGPRV